MPGSDSPSSSSPPLGEAENEPAAEARTEEHPQDGRPVLVVSRERTETVPLLKELLEGSPEIEIVVDRRLGDRRATEASQDEPGGDVVPTVERREGQRRRRSSYYLL